MVNYDQRAARTVSVRAKTQAMRALVKTPLTIRAKLWRMLTQRKA